MPVKYSSVETVKSDIVPGVSYTLKKMSDARRAALYLATAEPKAKLRTLAKEAMAIEARPQDQPDPFQLTELWEQTGVETVAINAAWVRWGLKSIDGYEIDGAPATAETLLEDGQPELVQEIVDRIKKLAEMSEAELKNFDWRSTSGIGTDTPGNSTNATDASDKASSEAATAAVITPA